MAEQHADAWDARVDSKLGKPTLRGVSHSYTISAALAAGLVLLSTSKDRSSTIAAAVYVCSLVNVFSMSSLYHIPQWSPKVRNLLRRLDRASIYLLIAGTYTPVCVAGLPPDQGQQLLTYVWAGAIVGLLQQLIWPTGPKWVSASVYILLGWAALAYTQPLYHNLTVSEGLLLITGGLLYSIGAIGFAVHWPNPKPGVFAYHEVFHVYTIAASICHFAAVVLLYREPRTNRAWGGT